MKTILVAYDGTPEAKVALEKAAAVAKAFTANVIVTSVAPILVGAGRSMGAVDPVSRPEEHEAMLSDAKETLAAEGIVAETKLGVGYTSEAIVAAAEEVNADLIVVGSRDLSFYERWLGGSVSDSVVHRAHCDVLIAR